MDWSELDSFKTTSQPFGISFHPHQPGVITLGTISGSLEMFHFTQEKTQRVWRRKSAHTEACRAAKFFNDGAYVLSSSSDRSLLVSDSENGHEISRIEDAHNDAINRLEVLSPETAASGDDDGTIKIWDSRQAGCCATLDVHADYVSDMRHVPTSSHLLSTSGDGTIALINLRRNTVESLSPSLDDEMVALAILKHGSRVVCATQQGLMQIFSWPNFEESSDRYLGHSASIECMVEVDEDTLLTGSGDGHMRLVSILPSQVLSTIGGHPHKSVELLAVSSDGSLLASASESRIVKLWRKVVGDGARQELANDVRVDLNAAGASGHEENSEDFFADL